MAEERIAIIGAGIGGLAAAIRLAAAGRQVTLFEKEAVVGGKARSLTSDDVAIDAGPTVFTERAIFDSLFDAAGQSLDAQLTVRPADILARHAWGDGGVLDLFADPRASEAAIGDFAGAAAARGYRAFRAEAQRLYDTLEAPFLRSQRPDPITLTLRAMRRDPLGALHMRAYQSLWSALGGYFADPRLRQLFARYATYCGSDPFRTPGTLMLIAHVEARGVWMIEGGMAALAAALADAARACGATLRLGSRVSAIRLAGGRVAGLVTADGADHPADRIIANADPAAIAEGCFGDAVRRAVAPVPPRRRSLSALVWTGHARTQGFNLVRHNVFFSPDYAAEFAALRAGQPIADPSVYVCAIDRDARSDTPPPAGRERLQIIVNAAANGDTHRPSEEEIRSCHTAMLASLSRCGLALEADWPQRLTRPADFAALFPGTGGALYGRASHGWAASFRRQRARTRIPGLYCAGGATHPGAGVPMAALSGQLTAQLILSDPVSTLLSPRQAMPGGMSTRSAMTGASG